MKTEDEILEECRIESNNEFRSLKTDEEKVKYIIKHFVVYHSLKELFPDTILRLEDALSKE